MEEFKANAIAIGLRTLFNESYFDITMFHKLEGIMGARVDSDLVSQLELLHCVHYSDMPAAFRRELYRKVVDALGVPDVPEVEITDEGIAIIEPAKVSWIKRLIGGGS